MVVQWKKKKHSDRSSRRIKFDSRFSGSAFDEFFYRLSHKCRSRRRLQRFGRVNMIVRPNRLAPRASTRLRPWPFECLNDVNETSNLFSFRNVFSTVSCHRGVGRFNLVRRRRGGWDKPMPRKCEPHTVVYGRSREVPPVVWPPSNTDASCPESADGSQKPRALRDHRVVTNLHRIASGFHLSLFMHVKIRCPNLLIAKTPWRHVIANRFIHCYRLLLCRTIEWCEIP